MEQKRDINKEIRQLQTLFLFFNFTSGFATCYENKTTGYEVQQKDTSSVFSSSYHQRGFQESIASFSGTKAKIVIHDGNSETELRVFC